MNLEEWHTQEDVILSDKNGGIGFNPRVCGGLITQHIYYFIIQI